MPTASLELKLEMDPALSAEALPVGIVEEAKTAVFRVHVKRGDVLIMMSDGVSEVFEEETIIGLIRAHRDDTPQQLADCMLDEAKSAQDGKPIDDMTVLCARIMDMKAPEE